MKVIIPLAGKGTRLLPLTKTVPKPLIRVAGRPVMDYVMDQVGQLDVEELIIITGHLKDRVESHVRQHYHYPARFIEQKIQDGTASAIDLARPYVDGPVLIIFVDTLFDADLGLISRVDADGIIWVKEVEDYQRFGVVVTDERRYMKRIVEKPSEPVSKLANIGLYYIRDWRTLFDGITWTRSRPPVNGEYFLTDAFQYMVDQGKKLLAAPVGGWYDCGKVGTVLETNRHLLESGSARRPRPHAQVRVLEPVYVADGVELEDCTIGPNVSIDAGAVVKTSVLRDAIVGERAKVVGSTVEGSMVGDDTEVMGQRLKEMIAAGEELAKAP
ncbi:MAG: NTP transferase domain-containing protein [Gemmatimonadetes bacterium]|nr:NTP transferase domain-containing protein [Gemmatimonadota bacterium]